MKRWLKDTASKLNVFRWLKNKLDQFNQVVSEGNYRLPPMTFVRLITGIKPKLELPATAEAAMGTSMIDTGKNLGERFLWAFSITALGGVVALKWAALGFGLAGIGVYSLEYIRAKKSREDEITEVNLAGQRVKGKRADLYRLHNAQVRVMNITDKLSHGEETAGEAVRKILDSVKDERARVEVLDAGRYKASATAYEFTEPDFRFVTEMPEFDDKSSVRIDSLSLRPGWDSQRASADEIVERLAALEESLPPELREKLEARRAQNTANDKKAAPDVAKAAAQKAAKNKP